MIVGLTGPNAAGKGEAASYIKSRGFTYHSLSDTLRKEAEKLGIEPLRENLIELGNELRRKNGASYLALRTIEKLSEKENHIVDSIRNPYEIEALKKVKGFFLIGVDAPAEIRFERSLKRQRPGDAGTLSEFIEKEERENKDDSENQQLKKCLGMADILITNETTIQEFHKKIDEAIKNSEKTRLG